MGISRKEMSETRQVKQVPPQPQPQANEEEEEQVQSEEEPMDPELLKALKNSSIEDDMKNIDLNKKDNKNKSKKGKKTSNKKGDFLDFAQEKGIEFKLQYEDKEDQKKKLLSKRPKRTSKENLIKKILKRKKISTQKISNIKIIKNSDSKINQKIINSTKLI